MRRVHIPSTHKLFMWMRTMTVCVVESLFTVDHIQHLCSLSTNCRPPSAQSITVRLCAHVNHLCSLSTTVAAEHRPCITDQHPSPLFTVDQQRSPLSITYSFCMILLCTCCVTHLMVYGERVQTVYVNVHFVLFARNTHTVIGLDRGRSASLEEGSVIWQADRQNTC